MKIRDTYEDKASHIGISDPRSPLQARAPTSITQRGVNPLVVRQFGEKMSLSTNTYESLERPITRRSSPNRKYLLFIRSLALLLNLRYLLLQNSSGNLRDRRLG